MRRFVLLSSLLVLIPLAGACGGPSAGALGGKSAAKVLALARAAAQKEGSFHFIDQTGTGSNALILTGDIGPNGGQEQLNGPNGELQVRLVGTTVYVKASVLILESALKLTASVATANAGKWIGLVRTDAPYETAAQAMEPEHELAGYIPAGDAKTGSVTTLSGHDVLAVSGTAPAAAAAHAVATLYVSTTAPFVPVGGTLNGTGAQSNESDAVAFTAWGEAVHTSVPAGSLPYSLLVSS
jgi:hypothetical protein